MGDVEQAKAEVLCNECEISTPIKCGEQKRTGRVECPHVHKQGVLLICVADGDVVAVTGQTAAKIGDNSPQAISMGNRVGVRYGDDGSRDIVSFRPLPTTRLKWEKSEDEGYVYYSVDVDIYELEVTSNEDGRWGYRVWSLGCTAVKKDKESFEFPEQAMHSAEQELSRRIRQIQQALDERCVHAPLEGNLCELWPDKVCEQETADSCCCYVVEKRVEGDLVPATRTEQCDIPHEILSRLFPRFAPEGNIYVEEDDINLIQNGMALTREHDIDWSQRPVWKITLAIEYTHCDPKTFVHIIEDRIGRNMGMNDLQAIGIKQIKFLGREVHCVGPTKIPPRIEITALENGYFNAQMGTEADSNNKD